MYLVRELRTEREMSQADLSRLSGVSQQAISKIETGARVNIGILTLEALARALGCELSDIYKPDKTPAA